MFVNLSIGLFVAFLKKQNIKLKVLHIVYFNSVIFFVFILMFSANCVMIKSGHDSSCLCFVLFVFTSSHAVLTGVRTA